jgi:hypothetical protein
MIYFVYNENSNTKSVISYCLRQNFMQADDVRVYTAPPPFIEVKGSHREIGRQIGEACSGQIRHSIENARNLISSTFSILELDWDGALIQASKYIPFAQERYPKYVDELVGMSEGAGVPLKTSLS